MPWLISLGIKIDALERFENHFEYLVNSNFFNSYGPYGKELLYNWSCKIDLVSKIAEKALLTFTLKVYCRVENDDYAEYETGKDNESITSSQRIKNSVYEMDSLTDSIPFTITSPPGIRNFFVSKLKYSIETGLLSKTVSKLHGQVWMKSSWLFRNASLGILRKARYRCDTKCQTNNSRSMLYWLWANFETEETFIHWRLTRSIKISTYACPAYSFIVSRCYTFKFSQFSIILLWFLSHESWLPASYYTSHL